MLSEIRLHIFLHEVEDSMTTLLPPTLLTLPPTINPPPFALSTSFLPSFPPSLPHSSKEPQALVFFDLVVQQYHGEGVWCVIVLPIKDEAEVTSLPSHLCKVSECGVQPVCVCVWRGEEWNCCGMR